MRFQKQTIYARIYAGLSLLALILAACAPQGNNIPVTGETAVSGAATAVATLGVPPAAILAAQQWLATQLNVVAEQVQVSDVEHTEWTDSCLGLGRANESCLQAVTPGWRAVFEINNQRFEVRTDETGSIIRLASPEGVSGPVGGESGIENTLWNLVSFGETGAETPVVQGSIITLLLVAGQAAGTGGCNGYSGSYQVEGNSISFGAITSTKMACADSQMTEQEGRYFQALETASEYELNGDQLRITSDDSVLIFEAALSQ
jgi:hypothetical protein